MLKMNKQFVPLKYSTVRIASSISPSVANASIASLYLPQALFALQGLNMDMLYQTDVNIAFLHGELQEVYAE